MNKNRHDICQKQEQFVLERSARLNLEPGRGDRGDEDDGGDLDDREGGGGGDGGEGGGEGREGGEGGGGSKILVDGRRSGRPTIGNTRGPRGPKKQKQPIQTILSRQLDTVLKVLKS